jgi:hypothetical protein
MDGVEYATWALVVATAVAVLINVLLVWDNHWHFRRQANPVLVIRVAPAKVSKSGEDLLIELTAKLEVAGAEPAFNVEVSAVWHTVHRGTLMSRTKHWDLRTYPYLALHDGLEWKCENRASKWASLDDGFPSMVDLRFKVRYQNTTRNRYVSQVSFRSIPVHVPSGESTSFHQFESGHFSSKRDWWPPDGRLDRFMKKTRLAWLVPERLYPWK